MSAVGMEDTLASKVLEAFSDGGVLSRAAEQFRERSGQTEMAMAVARTIEQGGMLVVEAGTGVGKTFSYLVPALLSGERVLLSTATKALQDQLFGRDLPRLVEALGLPVRTALLKGRGSYLCLHRLDMARHDASLPERGSLRTLAKIEQWSKATRTGDLAELPGLDERSPLIPLVSSTRENCLGAQCPQFKPCHVNLARREALAADVVVINHHLFFADLAVRERGRPAVAVSRRLGRTLKKVLHARPPIRSGGLRVESLGRRLAAHVFGAGGGGGRDAARPHARRVGGRPAPRRRALVVRHLVVLRAAGFDGTARCARVSLGHPLVDDRRWRVRLRRASGGRRPPPSERLAVHARAHRALVPVRSLLPGLPHARLPRRPFGARHRHMQAGAGLVRLQRGVVLRRRGAGAAVAPRQGARASAAVHDRARGQRERARRADDAAALVGVPRRRRELRRR